MDKNNTTVKAINKNVRTSPRKLALVCNFIKGKKADCSIKRFRIFKKKNCKRCKQNSQISYFKCRKQLSI